ncbi:hypothetical protein ACVWZ6_002656 [Bradyrhizobium sp. GM6.1]
MDATRQGQQLVSRSQRRTFARSAQFKKLDQFPAWMVALFRILKISFHGFHFFRISIIRATIYQC